jgi:hypothetical protein
MKKKLDPSWRRNFLKTLWLWSVWLVTGSASAHIVESFLSPKETVIEKELWYHDAYISRIEKKIDTKVNDYNYIMYKFAGLDADTYTKQSRMNYVQEQLKKVNLPDYLKQTIPFVPFQESWYKLSAVSSVWAKWPWQFMESTWQEYGLVIWSGDNKKDYRTDMKKSSDAAIEYFVDVYKKLKDDPHYKSLESKYSLQEDDLLLPATINAYNSGSHHMLKAFKVMDTESSIRSSVDSYAAHRRGLFAYLTNEYIKYYKTYQSWPPFYYKESSDYVYCIEAFRYIHEKDSFENIKNGNTDNQLSESSVPPIDESVLDSKYHAVIGWGSSWLLATLASKALSWWKDFTRSQFLRTWIMWIWGIIWWFFYDWAKKVDVRWWADDIKEKFRKKKLQPYSYDDVLAIERKDLFMEIYYHAIATAKKSGNTRAAETLSKRSLQDVMDLKYYPWFQYLGDAAFNLYKQKSDNTYLQMAQYFYNRARELVQEQKDGKYKQPGGWVTKLDERTEYCKRALDMIDAEFSH